MLAVVSVLVFEFYFTVYVYRSLKRSIISRRKILAELCS